MLNILGNTVQNLVRRAGAQDLCTPTIMHLRLRYFLSSTDFPIKRQEETAGSSVRLVTRLGLDWRIQVRFPTVAVTLLSPSSPTKRGREILQ